MPQNPTNLKIVVYTPTTHANQIREALSIAGACHIGNYSHCSFSTKGIGRFQPLDNSQPYIGTHNQVQEVEEERIETICPAPLLQKVLDSIRTAHPYEEPAIDVYPLMDI